jgi:serine/threonine protein kinase
LAEEVLKATEYIHSIGVVHRDLKPGNIIVTRNGEHLKLIDFGLADNDHIAILKQPAGTPGYTSPEQATDNVPDIRNDIYSLGIILQQLLPERRYRSVINKCFLPLETRYRNANLLLKDLQKRAKRKQKIAIAIPIILTILMAAVLGLQASKLHRQEEARNRIDNAIEEGIRKADKVFETIAMEEMMDTCTNFRNIFPYYNEHYWDVDSCTKIYFDSIRPLFTKTEMYEIINAIKTHYEERRQVWFEKLQQINITAQ